MYDIQYTSIQYTILSDLHIYVDHLYIGIYRDLEIGSTRIVHWPGIRYCTLARYTTVTSLHTLYDTANVTCGLSIQHKVRLYIRPLYKRTLCLVNGGMSLVSVLWSRGIDHWAKASILWSVVIVSCHRVYSKSHDTLHISSVNFIRHLYTIQHRGVQCTPIMYTVYCI